MSSIMCITCRFLHPSILNSPILIKSFAKGTTYKLGMHNVCLLCWAIICGGVVVYWCIHSALTLRARVRISPSPCTFVLQQGNLSTLLLSTQVYNGDQVGCDRWLCLNLPAALWQRVTGSFRQGMLPREWKLCTVSAALMKCIQWPG